MSKQRLKNREKRPIDWDFLINDLVANCDIYHENYYSTNTFSGPSLHFHNRALKASNEEKPELIYALLVSWGMHRMGGGAQMNDYKKFSESLEACMDYIIPCISKNIEDISEIEFNQLENVFKIFDPMHSKPKIVAISKVLAHYLPNLIAPIDNEYTFRFVSQLPYMPRNWEEFEIFKYIHLKLFKVVIANKEFKLSAVNWINNNDFPWDTSYLKIVDNLIIGNIIHRKKEGKN